MAKIHSLKISNFRGIKTLNHTFGEASFICLVGRGDSGKTSILQAIEYALYPSWNPSISDNDFFNCDTTEPIEIEVTLRDLESSLLRDTKYGLYIRGLDKDGLTIHDEIQDEQEKVLTVLFRVDKELEPKWYVKNGRPHQEDIELKTADRANFNVALLSDYLDKHFSWSKGAPLYSLMKEGGVASDNSSLLDAMRDMKTSIDASGFGHLDAVVDKVKSSSQKFGLNIDKTKTSLDIKDLVVKDSKVTLHDDLVPLRLKGKGSKRIISIAIQTEVTKEGIVLVDEIEQGLEPDRVKHLVRTLFSNTNEQTFLTTHSQQVVEELEPVNIFMVNNDAGIVTIDQANQEKADNYKRLFRTCPEALYSNRVIVCEGKTEIGFCRALDKQRVHSKKPSMSARDVVYSLGEGDNFSTKAKTLKGLGKDVSVFCDSDKPELIPVKKELEALGIKVFDCDTNNNIEKQISMDLPWEGIKELYTYVCTEKKKTVDELLSEIVTKWSDVDTADNREIFFKASTHKKKKIKTVKDDQGQDQQVQADEDCSWFKRIDHGEYLGDVCFKYKTQMKQESKLNQMINDLDNWIGV